MSLRRLSAFLDAEEHNEPTLGERVQKVVQTFSFDNRLFDSFFRHRCVKERVTIVKLSVSLTPLSDGIHAGVLITNNS